MAAYFVGVLVPFLVTLLFRNSKNEKKRGLPVNVGGEPGYAIRNYRFASPVETSWAGIKTLAALFEQACKQDVGKKLFGTRRLISREMEVFQNGRLFEKLHLGNYEWLSYNQVCSFASGLVKIGHEKGERVAIFADT